MIASLPRFVVRADCGDDVNLIGRHAFELSTILLSDGGTDPPAVSHPGGSDPKVAAEPGLEAGERPRGAARTFFVGQSSGSTRLQIILRNKGRNAAIRPSGG